MVKLLGCVVRGPSNFDCSEKNVLWESLYNAHKISKVSKISRSYTRNYQLKASRADEIVGRVLEMGRDLEKGTDWGR